MQRVVDREASAVVVIRDGPPHLADEWYLIAAELVVATAKHRANRDEDWLLDACAAARARAICGAA